MKLHTRLAAAGAAALAVIGVGVGVAAGATSSVPSVYRFYEVQESFKGQPGPGSTIEFTDRNFMGNHLSHASKWTSTDHFVCVFSDQGQPTCDGQIAIGPSMLLVHGTGGQGAFTIPITGGTGKFHKSQGTLSVHDVGNENSDIVITLH